MISSAERMREMASSKAQTEADRELFKACVSMFRASGWWLEDQIAEYTQDAGQIMNGSDKEAKQAARDFWSDRTSGGNSAAGINQRIRADLATQERKVA